MATILIVDVNSTDRRSYITLLSNYGHRLLEADDGVKALELARVELPDLIITDVLMPNMDGFTLVRGLQAEPLLASTPLHLPDRPIPGNFISPTCNCWLTNFTKKSQSWKKPMNTCVTYR
jgi:CheY-like chemotaxis protein